MSKYKHKTSGLSGLIDSDGEEDHFVAEMPTPDSAKENKVPAKKGRGKAKVAPTKVTKAAAPARRLSGRLNSKAKTAAPAQEKRKRPALAEKTNQQTASDTEEVDEFGPDSIMLDAEVEDSVLDANLPKKDVKKAKPAAKKKLPTKQASVSSRDIVKETRVDEPEVGKNPRKGRPSKKDVLLDQSPEKVVMETQVVEIELEEDGDEETEETIRDSPPRKSAHTLPVSRQQQPSAPRRRAGSASDTERSDPATRRRLGEMTQKYEALNLRYQDLKEIGIKEGERNYEKLRKQSEEKTKIANSLIASLKADVAHQTELAKQSILLKKQMDIQTGEMAVLQAQVAQLKVSLSEAQAETKTLSAKLASNRTAAASVESAHSKVPGSAVKTHGGIRLMGTAEAAQVAQAAQLKEDIYSDLTGLIIQGVKRDPEEDIFNCIQTGRNGTLHFKLAAANDKASESYDDAQCSYIPQLDPSRDSALMDLLPDYLVDEIIFPRPQAARFYARVVKALTEKSS